jgi:hypothetical protein
VLIRCSIANRRVALPLLAALMLLLQALGLVHAVMHGAGHGARHALHATSVASHDAPADLFGDHDDDASCRLYDQLAHADAACGMPVFALCDTVQALADVALPSGRHAPQAAGFLARGPPFTA